MDIKSPITLISEEDRAKRRREEKLREWLTGFMCGIMLTLILTLLLAIKVMAAPVNGPADAERAAAETYLSENRIEIPEDVTFWCEKYGQEYDICPEILEAVCWVESRCTPTAQSPDKECKGLMQIKPACHTTRMNRLNARNVFGVWENIKTGADYLAELQGTEDISVALALYNGQSAEAVERIRAGEYTGYVKKVLTISTALERAHGK